MLPSLFNSPVAQNAGYGLMRQGRPGVRAKFVQLEARMSQTGANADEWLPVRPGTEGVVALAHCLPPARLCRSLRRTGAQHLPFDLAQLANRRRAEQSVQAAEQWSVLPVVDGEERHPASAYGELRENLRRLAELDTLCADQST